MRVHLSIVLCASLIASCASAPSSRSGVGTRYATSPPPAQTTAPLSLCSGVSISNAPPTDGFQRIANYQPQAYIHGAAVMRAPVSACVSSGFGPRRGGASGFHHGVDLYTRDPAPVYAGGDGVIEAITVMRGYGNTILIRHAGGVKTRYAHLSAYAPGLRTGDRVRAGEFIGHTGRTGNATAVHLHYEIIVDGKPRNPLTVGNQLVATLRD